MRRSVILLSFIALLVSFLASCSKDKDSDLLSSDNDYFAYPVRNIMQKFGVDESHNLYYAEYKDSGKVRLLEDKNGETYEEPIMESYLYCIDFNGNLVNTYNLGETITNNLYISNGKAYYTLGITIDTSFPDLLKEHVDDLNSIKDLTSNTLTVINIYAFDLQDQSTTKIYQLTDLDSINDIEIIDDKIFILGIDNSRLNKEYNRVGDNDYYYYSGEVIKVVDMSAGTDSELEVDFPISFSKTLDNNLLIYAHDGIQGYYFIEYNCNKQEFSKKIYYNLDMLYKFMVFNEKNDILYGSYNTSTPSLSVAYMDLADVTTDLMPDVGISFLECQGDYAYYANHNNSGRIERIKISSYMRGNKAIQMFSATSAPYTPFGCGFIITRQYPSIESFVLSVLSQDSDFDICLMDSRQDISLNIRNKGSFYPLNDVDGVKEYLDACFPYIKEAAMTEDGDIWMLPIMVNIPVLIYNEDYCKANGIDLSVPMDIYTFLNKVSDLRINPETKDSFCYSDYLFKENLIYQYLRSNTGFDNNSFRELAMLMKDKFNYTTNIIDINVYTKISLMLSNGDTDNFLFNSEYYQNNQLQCCEQNNLRAAPFPNTTENQPNIATCIYLCVNPSSKNLKSALQYISSLTYYLREKDDLVLFSDRQIESKQQGLKDLYQIYQNGDIQFTLPDELFENDLDKYLNDEIDLSEFIKEADRKIDTYLKE